MARDLFQEAGLVPKDEPVDLFESYGVEPPKRGGLDRSAADIAGDIGVTALKGAIGLPEAFVGLADIPTGGRVGKALEVIGYRPEEAKKTLDSLYSPAQQAANRNLQQSDGFVDTLATAVQNPSTIAIAAGESVPSMLGGAGIARNLLKAAPKLAPVIAGAIGEGVIGAGSAAEQSRAESKDGLISEKQSASALASGVGTGLLGFAGGKLAQKLGVADIDTVLASGAGQASAKGFARQAVESGISEGVFEELPQSVQEQMWQNFSEGREISEGVGKQAAMGMLAGAAMGGAGGGYNAAFGPKAELAPSVAATPADSILGSVAPVTAAETALYTPKNLTALDRVSEIDARLASGEQMPEGETAALAEERATITAEWPQSVTGASTSFSTEAGARLDANYALMDAGDLTTSHDENLRPSPSYPAELQPRERERAASEMQVSGIVQKLDPARLGLSADAATGAPIVGADGLVESGNARTIALKRVYSTTDGKGDSALGSKAHAYREFLKSNAEQFGITPESVDAMVKPVLVRVRSTPVNRSEFARQANASTVAQMSPSETAKSDAARLDVLDDLAPDENGDFSTSRDFIRRFMAKLPGTEQSGMIDAAGQLSQAGYSRIRNAVLAKAYGDSPVLSRMVESMDDNLRNVGRALLASAPAVAKVRQSVAAGALFDADITPDLMTAVEALSKIKDSGQSTTEALAQAGMFDDGHTPESRELTQFLADNLRRPRVMTEFIQRYMEALTAAGNPNQGSIFGDATAPKKSDLLTAARGKDHGTITENPSGRQPSGAEGVGAESGRQSTNAQGGSGGAQSDEAANQEVDQQWRMFDKDSGTLGIPRANMPQVAIRLRPAMLAFMESKGISYEREDVSPDKIKPTQAEYSLVKAERARNIADDRSDKSAVLVSSDGYVLDGHHRWIAKAQEKQPVNVIRFDAPIDRLLDAVREFSGTTTSNESGELLAKRTQAVERFYDAAGDLAQALSKHTRAAIIPEQTPGLMPTLVKLFDAAFDVVGTDAKRATAWVKERLKALPEFRTKWNKILPETYRKAALQAAEQFDPNKAVQGSLFGEKAAAPAQADMFMGQKAAEAPKPGKNQAAGVPDNWTLAGNKKEWVDEHGFVRGLFMSDEERAVEQDFYDHIRTDTPGLIKLYLEGVLKPKDGKLVDPDRVKELSKHYKADPSLANAVHEPSSHLSKIIFETLLRENIDKPVVFTAGGGGSGKTEAMPIAQRVGGISPEGVVFDSTLSSFASAKKKIDQVIKAGGKAVVVYTNCPLEKAFAFAMGRPRVVKAVTLVHAHIGASNAVRDLFGHYKNNADVRIIIVNNFAGKEDFHAGSIDQVPVYDYNESERALYELAKQARYTGTLPEVRYAAIVKGLPSAARDLPIREAGSIRDPDDARGDGQIHRSPRGNPPEDRRAGGVNEHAKDRSGIAQGQESGALFATDKGGNSVGVRAGSGRGNQQPDRHAGAPDSRQAGVLQAPVHGSAEAGGDNEQRGQNGQRNRPGRNAGIPAGRDIPVKSGRNYQFGDSDLTYAGSWQTKARQNVDAVELIKNLQSEGRQATRDEQATLAKFVGWGSSEMANSIFGEKLTKQLAALDQYDKAMAAIDAKGKHGNDLRRSEAGYYDAFSVLKAKNEKIEFYSTYSITREQLQAAKPDSGARKWGELRDRLKAALTPEEWDAASRSTQYAHYTSKPVVKALLAAVEKMGFKGGTILEPGAGIGIFPGLMNSAMATNSVYTGIESEPVTGGILKQLFPDERILVESFVDSKLPENYYDVAFGNPPFGSFKVLADPKYAKNAFALHDYFFAKSLDSVKPGGLLVFVTSRYTMDKQGDKARSYMGERADLVGAIRLPQTAFQKNAGTEVVTDVLFLRKKVPGQTFGQAQDWMKLGEVKTDKVPALVNEYFVAHPEMVLGEHSRKGSMYSKDEYTVTPKGGDIEAQFAAATENLPADVFVAGRGSAAEAAKVREIDFNPKAKKEGSFYVTGAGVLMQREGGVGVRAEEKHQKNAEVIKDYVVLRDAVKQSQYDQLNDGDWESSLKALQKAYAAFVKKNGRLFQNTSYMQKVKADELDADGAPTGNKIDDEELRRRFPLQAKLRDDPEYTLVNALENFNEETGEVGESGWLTKRTLGAPAKSDIQTPTDALLATLNDTGVVDVGAIADMMDISEQEAINALGSTIYEDPAQGWQMADEYLSGNVKKKLANAEEAAKSDKRYARNVEALKAVQPTPRAPADITPQIGMNWIPGAVYSDFIEHLAGVQAKVEYAERTHEWVIKDVARERTERATVDWGVGDRENAAWIFEKALSGAPIRINKTVPDGAGGSKQEFDPDRTEAAQQKRALMRDEFRSWLFQDAARAEQLVTLYNDKFNTTVQRKFDGTHLTLPGTSKLFNIFDHVKRGAWRVIQSGNTYLAHAVGSGKTFEMVISAMEQKRLGKIKKPMVIVPGHMLQQFASEWQQLYPTARLMVADEQGFHTDNRRRFVSRVAMSDLDGVIMTHSSFKLLDLDPAFKQEMINQELEFMRASYEEAGGDLDDIGDKKKRKDPKIKRIEAQIERLEQELAKAMSSEGKDKNVRFDEMGVDFLYVDEAHLYRKLSFATNRQMKGIDSAGSQMAWDLFMKTRWLAKKNPTRFLAMASGTAITNTTAELYTVQRFMAPQVLEDNGLARFDDWAAQFGEESTEIEATSSGKYEPVTRFANFVNVGEMTQMFRDFADVLNEDHLAALLGDKRPKVAGGARKSVITPKTDSYIAFQDEQLKPRIQASRDWKPSRDEPYNPDPVININTDARLASIDMRFMDPALPNDPNSKLNHLIDGVIRVYKETAANEYLDKQGVAEPIKGSTQMVFFESGFGRQAAINRGFSARAWMEKRLREAGIPPAQVAFMEDYKKSSSKLKLFGDVNKGKVRVLVGSSAAMGTGVNAQQRLIALHHLDAPMVPAVLEQREGRIVRQGNKNPLVQVYAYSMFGSFDENQWGMLARKKFFIEQAMSGDPNIRAIEDVGEVSQLQMAAALVAENPFVLQLAGARAEVDKLTRLYRSHEEQRSRMREDYSNAGRTIEMNEKNLPAADKEAARVKPMNGDNFVATASGKEFTKRKDWGGAILSQFKVLADKLQEKPAKVGQISSFDVMFSGHMSLGQYSAEVYLATNENNYTLAHDALTDPVGVALRAANVLADLSRRPAALRNIIKEAQDKRDSLSSRLDSPFPLAEQLVNKVAEADRLEAEMIAYAPKKTGLEREQELEDAWAARTGAITPLFSRGDGGGMAVRDLKAVRDRVTAGMKNMPPVHVLEEPGQAPKALRDHIEKVGAWNDVEGATHEGEIYLFASNLASEERAEFVLAQHEITHYGLRGKLGMGLDAALQNVWMNNSSVRKAASVLRAKNKLSSNLEAVEEVLADMPSAELVALKGWRKLTAKVRDWFSEHGFARIAAKLDGWLTSGMSDQAKADLYAADLVRAARGWVKSGKGLGKHSTGATKLSRAAAVTGSAAPAQTAEQRADAIIAQSAATIQPADKLAKGLTQIARIDQGTTWIYNKVGGLLDRWTPEQIKAGFVADYGVPEAVIDRRVAMQGSMKTQLRGAGDLIDKLSTLTRAESRVAYEWMNNADPQAAAFFESQLPAESVKVMSDVKTLVDKLSQEAVKLGQLDPEAFKSNRFEYLRRSYVKHTTELTKGEANSRQRSISVLGDQYKGRGMTDSAPMAKIKNVAPEWWGRKLQQGKADKDLKGEKFIRLERRAPNGQGTIPLATIQGPGNTNPLQKGRLLEVNYWPAGEPIPAKYSAWDQSGTWDVRDTKGGSLILWRDFSKEERVAMGEIDEARYAIAKTLHGMIHDVETGRYLEWLAQRYAVKTAGQVPGKLVEASERMRDTFARGEWVQVPDSKILGTNVKKYGLLAGRYLPGPIWNDVRQMSGPRIGSDLWRSILGAWKTSKTALSPAVHTNNVMANFVMADWHDVTAGHVLKALRLILAAHDRDGTGLLGRAGNLAAHAGSSDREAAKIILDRFSDSGGNIGTWATAELQKEQLAPLLEALEKELGIAGQSPAAQVGVMVALQKMLQLKLPSAWDAFKPTKAGKAVTTEARNMLALYEAEDQFFRLAAWLKAKEDGATDMAAGKVARKSFLDYNINAPWVQIMRSTALPFVSFTYRAVPMLLETAAKKPWKLMKLGLLAGAVNLAGYLISGGDEDDERKLLPEEKAGKIFGYHGDLLGMLDKKINVGLGPKLIRMPWNDSNDDPVFLDIRRFIPVGDVFDLAAGHSAIPLPPSMVPGGALAVLAEIMLNRSQFTGKTITQETDVGAEQVGKVIDHLSKAFLPNLPLPNPVGYLAEAVTDVKNVGQTYSWAGISNAGKGKTDSFGREQSVAQAMASTFGVKLGSYPKDVLQQNAQREMQFKTMEIDRNISALNREAQKKGIDQSEFQKKVADQIAKKREVMEDFQKRMSGG